MAHVNTNRKLTNSRAGLAMIGGVALLCSTMFASAQQRIMTITATEPMTTDHPYGESSAPVYSMWCHIYGCLGRYDHRHPC